MTKSSLGYTKLIIINNKIYIIKFVVIQNFDISVEDIILIETSNAHSNRIK